MYKRLNDEAYTKLRKNLLREGTTDIREEFLRAALPGGEFCTFVRSVCGIGTEGTESLEVIDEKKLSPAQYINPPEDTERAMYEKWQNVPPETACRVTFWGEVTLNHIEQDKIEASYLAAGKDGSNGEDRIRETLKGGGDIDACVRAIILNMSGIPEARGNISVFANCPFGRAWWRVRLALEVQETAMVFLKESGGNDFTKIIKLLRRTNQYWEEIMRLVISRNSVLGDTKTRDVLVWILAKKLASLEEGSEKNLTLFNSKTARKICRLLGVRCASQELSILSADDLRKVIEENILLAID